MNGVLMSFLASFIVLLPASQTIENTSVFTEEISQNNMTFLNHSMFQKHSPVTNNSNLSTTHFFHNGFLRSNRGLEISFHVGVEGKRKRQSKRQSEKYAKRNSDHIIKDSTDPNKPKLRRLDTGRKSNKRANSSKLLHILKSNREILFNDLYENKTEVLEKDSLKRIISYYDIAYSKRKKEIKEGIKNAINDANSLWKKPFEKIYNTPEIEPSYSYRSLLHSNYTHILPPQTKLHTNYTKESSVPGQFLHTHRTKRLPQAIIVGVKKAGTRALLEFLKLHPNVEIAGPETHFFDKHYHKGLEWYREKMPASREDQVTIEKTPSYFVTKEAPQRIRKMNKDTKIIIVTRDPVTRAISDYAQAKSRKPNLLAFEEMVFLGRWAFERNSSEEKEELIYQNCTKAKDIYEKRICDTWGPVRIGLYARYMRRWLRHFPLQQIHFVHGEKLIVDPSGELALLQNFLRLPHYIGEHFFVHDPVKGFPCLRLPITSPENTSSKNDENDVLFEVVLIDDSKKISLSKNSVKNHRPKKYHNTSVVIQTRCLGETKGRKHPQVKAEIMKRLRDFYRPHNQIFYKQSKINFGWP